MWIVADWTIIAGAGVVAWRLQRLWVWPLAWLAIAARQHALLIIMHDAAHYLLLGKGQLNDVLADFCCAYPFGVTTAGYRWKHLRHHNYLNSERDPDWVLKTFDPITRRAWEFPKTGWQTARLFLRDLLGGGFWDVLGKIRLLGKRRLGPSPHGGRAPLGRRVGYYVALVGLITLLGAWPPVLLLWFVPIMTLLPAILHLRSVSEHFGLPGGHELANARNVHTSFWERWLLAPHGIYRHLDHHLFPYVPFYRLAELHEILRDDADYRRLAYENGAYLFGGAHSVVQDLVAGKPR